jgi:hypothetical protein
MVKSGDFLAAHNAVVVSVMRPIYDGEGVHGLWFVRGELRRYRIESHIVQHVVKSGEDVLHVSTSGELLIWWPR